MARAIQWKRVLRQLIISSVWLRISVAAACASRSGVKQYGDLIIIIIHEQIPRYESTFRSSNVVVTRNVCVLSSHTQSMAEWVRALAWTSDRVVLAVSNHAAATSLRNFDNSVYPALPVSFGEDTKSRRPLLSGVIARGNKISHPSAL